MAGPSPTAQPGILAQLLELVAAALVWLLSDKRRVLVAASTAAVVLLGGWWWNSRPVPKSDICAQAVALQSHLQTDTSTFDNQGFDMANRLGAAAQRADAGDGGNVAAVHAAGERLANLGHGKGIVYASLGEFEGPLSTIQAWCATSTAVAAPGVQDGPPVDDTTVVQDTPTGVVDPGAGTQEGGLVKALDSGCSQIDDGVLGVVGSRFVFSHEADLPVDDVPAGALATSTCTYDYNDATVPYTPLTVQIWSFDSSEAVSSMLSSINAPDPGQAAQPGMSATATFTFDGHPAAVARKADLIVLVTEESSDTGLSDQQLTDVAVQSMGSWRPA